jgi:16S rRNA (cytidine1402-2'-O)-methyltransferase
VHEEFWRGTLDAAAAEFTERKPRGEITLVIEGLGEGGGGGFGEGFGGAGMMKKVSGLDLEQAIAAMLEDGVSPSEASKRAAGELGARKKEAYAIALRLAGKQ